VITIERRTLLAAPRTRVFDLARSIDLHVASTGDSDERAVAGVTRGLIAGGEEVTWEARHFGVRQRFTSRITAFDRPRHFQDTMVRGAFRHFVHDHLFEEPDEKTTAMIDRLVFAAPLGLLGRLADRLVLARYLARFLDARNAVLKRIAESATDWQQFL
jgi:ligand-binding SRPBCC domain-containing protein